MRTIDDYKKALDKMEDDRERVNANVGQILKDLLELREACLEVNNQLAKIQPKYSGWAWVKGVLVKTKKYEQRGHLF